MRNGYVSPRPPRSVQNEPDSTNGKGDKRRGDKESQKRYAENWVRIFGKKKRKKDQ